MSQVREIVHNRGLFWVGENDTVADVARRMAELQVGAILVLEAGALRGIFSERDLMRRVVLERLDLEKTPVKNVMSTQLATIDESATVEDAMEAMQSHKCRHLPVMREGRVTAFLSMRDLIDYELARKTEELHHMRAYIQNS
ncbi:MAG: CBS domain-containing protein [Bryobacteraceae bacterium]|jgi:CBS domain-containing protein